MRRGLTLTGMGGALLASSITTLVPAGLWWAGVRPPWGPPPCPPLPALAIVRDMRKLVTTEVHQTTFLEGGNNHWEIKVLLHGLAQLGVDLFHVEYRDVDAVKRQVVLRLPPVTLISSKVDHDHSEECYMRAKVWFPSDPQLVRAEVWRAADKKLARLALDAVYVEQAKRHAELVLHDFFQKVQWNVRIEWIEEDAKAKDAAPSREIAKAAGEPDLPAGKAAVEVAAQAEAKGRP